MFSDEFLTENTNEILMQTLENKQKAVSYLLGELPEADRDSLEERLFIDEDFSQFVNDVENDLIDEYVRGELSADEKLKFENAFLKNETRREKIRAAQILQTKLFNETPEKEFAASETKVSFWETLSGFFRLPNFALASGLAVILLILFGAVWFLTRENKLDDRVKNPENINQPEVLPTPKTSPPENLPENTQQNINENSEINKNQPNTNSNKSETEPKKTPEAVKTPQDQPQIQPPRRIFAFTLLPPTRSSERPVLEIPENTETVNLQIANNFEKNFVKYTLEISNENGETILKRDFSSDGKRPKKSFPVSLPNEKLKAGGYEITLLGTSSDGNVEEINFYNFTVRKK
jgi:methionine-rich copper-binding protein CopC